MAEVRTVRLSAYAGSGDGWGGSLPLQDDAGDRLVDLTNLQFVTPTFLLRLRTFIDWHRLYGRAVRVVLPKDQNVARYIARMHVHSELPPQTFGALPVVRERDRRDVLIPLTRLSELREVDRMHEAVAELIFNHVDHDIASVADAFALGMSELAQNGVEHGRASPTGCYVAAQRYRKPTSRLVLAIADLGVGIPEHLRQRYPDIKEDHAVIDLATRERSTGTGRADRGFGFSQTIEEIQAAHVSSASILVRSGHGRLAIRFRDGGVTRRSEVTPYKRGTWVTVELGPTAS